MIGLEWMPVDWVCMAVAGALAGFAGLCCLTDREERP